MKILKMAFPFPENKIQMISRKKNCGDISLEIKSSKIMIEVKNIEGRVVPKKDRNKFIKNLEMNSDYTRGLLVSLKSKVDSAVQPEEVQVHHGKKFVFLDRFSKESESDKANILKKVIGMIEDN